MSQNNQPVTYENQDGIAIIRVDNPPVNALSHAVRAGLNDAIVWFEADETAKVAVIHCEGRTFFAGADIKEFGQPPVQPYLPELVNTIEASTKPVVAALHGTALGGGLEVALGCHYRVAMPTAKLGLPEVNLGILPGAGGTQRLPRLTGAQLALELITTGRQIGASAALEAGLLDEISAANSPLEAGIEFGQKVIANSWDVRRTSEIMPEAAPQGLFDDWQVATARKARGQMSPVWCVKAVRAAFELPFTEGLARERALFMELMGSDQREGLIHAFFSARQVGKLPELSGVTPYEVQSIGIIGGGTMGAGIATSALLAGLPVTLVERHESGAKKARDTIDGYLDGAVKRGKMSTEARANRPLITTTDYAALAHCDLVVEAVFESMAVKKEVFCKLDAVCKPNAVLATNTSYLDINEIADITSRPQNVVGLHFFSPAHVMKLLEVVGADKTAPKVLATSFALAKRLAKTAVRAGVCDGFIGNRILAHYREAADHMVLDGASPFQIDAAIKGFGFAMGPFEVSDLAGLDIGWATRKRKAPSRDPRARIPTYADRLCEGGHFGQKTGAGFYMYEKGQRGGTPNPEVTRLIEAERQARGINPRRFSDAEIVRRYMGAMVNEAAKVVEEGIARRPLDVDMVFLAGYGFPRYRGGPLKWADMQGLETILADLKIFAKEDDFFWQPAALLRTLVANGENFNSLNKEP